MRRAVLLVLFFAVCAAAADFTAEPQQYPFRFVAYGDMRFTTPMDTRDSDPVRRELLVRKIAEERPAFLAVTGDLVLAGNNPADWQQFDAGTRRLRDAAVQIFPTLGNHDLVGDPAAQHYLGQFPQLKGRRWYSVQYGNCFLFMLDSASDSPGGEERRWLADGLAHLPTGTRFVFFVLHHPPYTQSMDNMPGGGHSPRVPEQQLASVIEQAHERTRLPMFVIAGHVHNYERYDHNGVTYIVTGGGGATPYEIPRKPSDVYRDPGPTYHYTRWTVDRDTIKFEMVKLTADAAGRPTWTVRDSFQVSASR